MIKEIVIVAIAILGLCHAGTVHEPKPEQKKVPVPVEAPSDALESDDLTPEASAYDSWGGKRYGGGSRHGGGNKGHGGGHWGGQRGHGYKGHGGYSG